MRYIKAILAHPFRFKRYKDGLDIGIFWIIALGGMLLACLFH